MTVTSPPHQISPRVRALIFPSRYLVTEMDIGRPTRTPLQEATSAQHLLLVAAQTHDCMSRTCRMSSQGGNEVAIECTPGGADQRCERKSNPDFRLSHHS